ncbi:MAG: hypothetical protein HY902_20155 [Deltaproteobacteria bacterium]|nr:hypothetical protein [Deltaproteobacteria bacterium]
MATLTSANLRHRLVLQPRGYQFSIADNLYDLNWVTVLTRLVSPGQPGRIVKTRLATWELASMAAHLEQLAEGTRTLWQPRFFDSGLHLWLRRSTERPDLILVTVVLAQVTGPPPMDVLEHWRGDRMTHEDGLQGLRFVCTRGALALFAEELRIIMQAYPTRALRPTG